MRKSLLLVSAAALLLLAFACQQSQQEQSSMSLSDAQAMAAKENKPLLIDFYASWCGPCQRFTKASHEDPDIMKALEQVVLYKIDCEKGDGVALAKKYVITGYPTYVLANSQAETIARWSGYSKDYFLENLDKATTDLSTIDEKQAKFDTEPTVAGALTLAQYNASMDNYKQAVEYYTRAEQIGKDNNFAFDIFQNTVYGAGKGQFTYDDAVKAADNVFTSDTVENKVYAAYKMSNLAKEDGKIGDVAKYLSIGINSAKDSDDPDVKELNDYLQIDYSLYVEKDTAKAVEYKKATLGDNWMEDPQQLNSFAWWCYENNCDLVEAETLAKKAVDLSEPGSSRAMILDTVAHICKSLGKDDEAIKYMEMAVQDDPGNKAYESTLETFKQEI